MAGIDEVLERLITDLGFRRRLREDPAAALQGYDLDKSDLELLASQLDDSGGGQARGVEQRTSKSALFGLLAGLGEPPAGASGDPAGGWRPVVGDGDGDVDQSMVGDVDDPDQAKGGVVFDWDLKANKRTVLSDETPQYAASADQPPQSSFEFLSRLGSDDAPSGQASKIEPDEPALDAPVMIGDIRDGTQEDGAPPSGGDLGGEESASGTVLEDVVVIREVDRVDSAEAPGGGVSAADPEVEPALNAYLHPIGDIAADVRGAEATDQVESDTPAGVEEAAAIRRSSPDVTDPAQASPPSS
jgi:hypothetical protein